MTDTTPAATSTVAATYALLLDRVFENCVRSIEDLSVEELNHLPHEQANSIGFDIWHVARTIDNVLFFVFDRETPLWLRDGYNDRFALPKVAQGTGMSTEEARTLRFPDPALFLEYVRALREACVPRVAAMTDEYLQEAVLLKPWGEQPRAEHIGQVLIAHGNSHLGKASLARTLLGHEDLGF